MSCEFSYALINDHAKGPTREPDSVGFDMYAFNSHVLKPRDVRIIPVGFHGALSPGYGSFVWDRSSFGSKGIHVFRQLITSDEVLKTVTLGGCLDWSYRGQWGVILHNMSDVVFEINHQQRIAQFVIVKCELPEPREMTMAEILAIPSIRGQGAFGCSDGQNDPVSAQGKLSV